MTEILQRKITKYLTRVTNIMNPTVYISTKVFLVYEVGYSIYVHYYGRTLSSYLLFYILTINLIEINNFIRSILFMKFSKLFLTNK